MTDITTKAIVLKLNKNWAPVGYSVVSKAIVDLCAGETCYAVDIDYARDKEGNVDFTKPTVMRPVDWEEWVNLPIREWDIEVRSPSITIRVPTVIIAKNYAKMPVCTFKGKPSKRSVWKRDRGIDQYTGKKLKEEDATLDHVIPRSRGGLTKWENLVLTHKEVNWKKGNKTNEEAGLKLLHQPKVPDPVPMSALINEARHPDWEPFLIR